jgi:hypothetical protein
MESKANKMDGEENLALFGQSNKGRGKGPNKGKGKSEESTSQPRKKHLSKIKCFSCHKQGHYASQCPNKKKDKGKQQQKQLVAFAETQMNKFVAKFEKDFSLVSCLSASTILRNAWYVDSGASQHRTSTRQLFSSMKKHDSRIQVELVDVAGVGTIPF